jgi:hypothetical protein
MITGPSALLSKRAGTFRPDKLDLNLGML